MSTISILPDSVHSCDESPLAAFPAGRDLDLEAWLDAKESPLTPDEEAAMYAAWLADSARNDATVLPIAA